MLSSFFGGNEVNIDYTFTEQTIIGHSNYINSFSENITLILCRLRH